MLAYRFHSTLFTHTIAAHSMDEAAQIAIRGNIFTYSDCKLEQWQTPDIWTRRAVDMALAPGTIDTIPRFVVDRKDGPVYLDIDDVPTKLQFVEVFKVCLDSELHGDWILACNAERERGSVLQEHAARVASERDVKRYVAMTRALAGAWGLGPIPEWHAAILPALIALDVELVEYAGGTPVTWFESDSDELLNHLSVIRESDIAGDLKTCARHIAHSINCFRPVGTICSDYILRRAWAKSAMSTIGWLPRANLREYIESIDKASR